MNKRGLNDLVRLNIKKMNSYSSARDQYIIKKTKFIYLDANESPFENGVNRYPNNKHYELKTVVSKIKKVQESQIVFGNGMDEILDLIVRVFCNPSLDQIITLPPTYGMYNVIANSNDIENIEVPLNSDFSINVQKVLSKASKKTKIIFLCSPNNQTGNSFKLHDVVKLINEFDGIIVLDEAYIDFSTSNSLIALINKHDNLIITQTLSKAYGMAGLRLGMALSNKKIIDYINKIKLPYNINSLSEKRVDEENNADKVSMLKQQDKVVSELTRDKKQLQDKVNLLEKHNKEELRPKAKIIEKTFDKIKQNERRSRTNVA